jgi:hypothetical protein
MIYYEIGETLMEMTILVRPLSSLRGSRIITLTSWVTSLSFLIPDHRFKTLLIGFVFYNLLTPVRKQDEVRSFGFLVLPAFFMTEVTSRIGVVNLVRELIVCWFLQENSVPQFTTGMIQETFGITQFKICLTGETYLIHNKHEGRETVYHDWQ